MEPLSPALKGAFSINGHQGSPSLIPSEGCEQDYIPSFFLNFWWFTGDLCLELLGLWMDHSSSPPSPVISPLSLHIIFPLYMSVSVSKFLLFYKDTSHIALWLNVCCHFSYFWLFLILWTIPHQAPLSLGFSRQEYWSGVLCPPLGDLPNLWIKPALAGKFFTTSTIWTEWPHLNLIIYKDSLQIRYMSKVLEVRTSKQLNP